MAVYIRMGPRTKQLNPCLPPDVVMVAEVRGRVLYQRTRRSEWAGYYVGPTRRKPWRWMPKARRDERGEPLLWEEAL